jgi:hypothetical protein
MPEGEEETALAEVPAEALEMIGQQDPEEAIAFAGECADKLIDIVESRPDKVIINNKTYLGFDEYQILGKFYAILPRTDPESVKFVEFGEIKGFEAVGEAIHVPTGKVVSRQKAFCLSDDANWSKRDLAKMASMAATRAQTKAMRSCLGWVATIAGYESSPHEEGVNDDQPKAPKAPKRKSAKGAKPASAKEDPPEDRQITRQERAKLFATARGNGWNDEDIKAALEDMNYSSTDEIMVSGLDSVIEFFSTTPGPSSEA